MTVSFHEQLKQQLSTCSIDDILADSDSDLPEDMETEEGGAAAKNRSAKSKAKSKQARSTYIREDADEIVDLADLKSIGNVLSKISFVSST